MDILFANGGGYETPGDPEFSRVFLNESPDKMFKEVTKKVLGPEPMTAARAIRVADINNDGNMDIAVGTSYQTQNRNYEIEAMDLNADGYLDVITMNDGQYLDDGPYARRNHIFLNNGKGGT